MIKLDYYQKQLEDLGLKVIDPDPGMDSRLYGIPIKEGELRVRLYYQMRSEEKPENRDVIFATLYPVPAGRTIIDIDTRNMDRVLEAIKLVIDENK